MIAQVDGGFVRVFRCLGWRSWWHLRRRLERRGSLLFLPPWRAVTTRASTAARVPAGTAALAEAAEQDPRQGEEAERFPERDPTQSEDARSSSRKRSPSGVTISASPNRSGSFRRNRSMMRLRATRNSQPVT